MLYFLYIRILFLIITFQWNQYELYWWSTRRECVYTAEIFAENYCNCIMQFCTNIYKCVYGIIFIWIEGYRYVIIIYVFYGKFICIWVLHLKYQWNANAPHANEINVYTNEFIAISNTSAAFSFCISINQRPYSQPKYVCI